LLGAACVFAGTHTGDARAQASGAAGVSEAASSVAAGAQYAVKPGQSLNDIAGELTGSKDRATREKMARALFDANPNAFMGKDPSRLRLGSVLTVPAVDVGAASASAAASAAASAPAESAAVQAPASTEAVTPAPTASAAAATQAVEPVPGVSEASAVAGAAPASEAIATSAASAAMPDSVPAPAPAPAPATAPRSSSTGIIAGVGVLVVLLALFALRASKRRRAPESDAVSRDATPPVTPVVGSAAAGSLDGAAVQRDEAELNAVAASMEDYDAAQSFETPTDEEPRPVADAGQAASASVPQAAADSASALAREPAPRPAPFMPEAPAARHRDFVSPLPTVAALEAETEAREAEAREAEAQETAAREAAAREAAAREAAEREAAAKEAAAKEAAAVEAREAEAREAAAREAEARDVAAREAAAKDAAAQDAAAREAQWEERAGEMERRTREAQAEDARAATERDGRAQTAMELEAAARQAQAVQPAAQESHLVPELPQERPPEEPAIHETPVVQPEPAAAEEYDDEPTPAARFPQPKFPREAIEALGSLDLGLPPRRELSSAPPPVAQPVTPQPLVEPHAAPAPDIAPSIEPEPMRPQPVAETEVLQRQSEPVADPAKPPFAAQEIESGTAGPASVAGLGASPFGPMRLDFSVDLPSSQTEPLPAFTPEQIATIARNKLELAAEYIDLGDLSGARTLLQEVIDSNDPATRQQAAALLSTLAPHS
jgi:FimV-like protein